jgi:hypothetical protein
VLRTAGTSKRANPEKSEPFLMMRTLRDMNMSKFVAEDVPLFLSLIDDLFPGMKADRASFPEVRATPCMPLAIAAAPLPPRTDRQGPGEGARRNNYCVSRCLHLQHTTFFRHPLPVCFLPHHCWHIYQHK